MKTTLASFLTALTLASTVQAAVYSDTAGDFTGGPADLDISSVNVSSDGTTLTFVINLVGNPMNATWYNYFVGIAPNALDAAGGNLNATGGWGKDIQMSTGGMDYFVGSFPGFGGYSLLTWNGSGWTTTGGATSMDATSVTIPVALSSLGLGVGDTIKFDVWASTQGGDHVLDALSDGTTRSWNNSPFDTGANALFYTVEVIPEPATGALLGLGGLFALFRSRKARGVQ